MLNISPESISNRIDKNKYTAFRMLEAKHVGSFLLKIMGGVMFIGICAMFLPWTQNIRADGYVTTLNPYDRPQNVQALIGGRIEKWYVQEGDIVSIGDTIVKISEVKEEYLDPQLLERTEGQINAKAETAKAYASKADRLQEQYRALLRNRDVKLEQNRIKMLQNRLEIQSLTMDLEAAKVKRLNAKNQLTRIEELYNEGLKSLTDLETKRFSFQEAEAKLISLENKLEKAKNEILNLEANVASINNDFEDKIAKSRSEQMSAISAQYDTEASINKLQSEYNAYSVRRDNYIIKSPINGMISKAIQSGIGEIVKNGDNIVSIVPTKIDLAVESYVEPMDLPLLKKGQEVRILFDGWPAIVFSGWPNTSYGTFGGVVFAIDQFISDNGKYRILIAPDPEAQPWPEEVRVGGGANSLMLLENVRVGYEIWRQMNGFPPDYYNDQVEKELKTKAPLSKVK